MARKGPELCMFCGSAPCECEGVAKPKKKRIAKKAVKSEQKEKEQLAEPTVERSEDSSEDFASLVPPSKERKRDRRNRRFGSNTEAQPRRDDSPRKNQGEVRSRNSSSRSIGTTVVEQRAIQAFARADLLSRLDSESRFKEILNPSISGGLAAEYTDPGGGESENRGSPPEG